MECEDGITSSDSDDSEWLPGTNENISTNRKKKRAETWKYKLTRSFLYGWYFIVRPCGFIVYEAPLYKSEGVKRTIEIWNEAFEGVAAEERPSYLVADKGCAIRYYINNSDDQQLIDAWSKTIIIVDRYHGGLSHLETEQAINVFCQKHCDVYKIWKRLIKSGQERKMDELFPGLYIEGGQPVGNTQAQEQSMNQLGDYSACLRAMRLDNQIYAMFWIAVNRNEEYARNHPERHPNPSADPNF